MNQVARPALGETVHYVSVGGKCLAAIVVGHSDAEYEGRWPNLDLRVQTLTACFPAPSIPCSSTVTPQTWHWGCGRT